ncbi:hypothetical protein [Adhaeribacter soli]|uniref:SH3 domain-containing protein n=1 Tax=Adhaeribacter soli TaxID=2607655 RepID=A0A5N1IZX0_9BACT|nr:hypothetical protein [Adhaeribacter soli]KAA9339995.1 hypothetical protein F0P94_06500 [Adhaeribacter soli]
MSKSHLKLLLANLFFLATLDLFGQTPLGKGLVSIDCENGRILEFYPDTTDIKATKTIKILGDILPTTVGVTNHQEPKRIWWGILSLNEQGEWNESQWLKPEQSGFSLELRFKQQTKGWYEVIVNNQNGQTYWLRKSKFTKYLSWEDHLKRQRSISRLPASNQPIRRQPTEQSKSIKYSGPECFRIRSVSGDWVEIFLIVYLNEDPEKPKHKIKTGWIKWRNGDNLLINYSCPYINGIKQEILTRE